MPAGDRYVEVTLEDMERFLKRAFRALRPKKGESKGEVYYDLNLSDDAVFIRVWTSIRPRSGSGAGLGEDAIRVTMITKGGKPLMPKGKIVMRTKNWRNALQDRVEELHEIYESKPEWWKNRRRERDEGGSRPRDTMPSVDLDGEAEVMMLEEMNAEGGPPPRRPPSPPPAGPTVKKTKPGEAFEGGYRGLPSGGFGVEVPEGVGRPGLEGFGKTQGGRRTRVRLLAKVKSAYQEFKTRQMVELWSFEDVAKVQRGDAGGGRWAANDPLIASVADRYLSV